MGIEGNQSEWLAPVARGFSDVLGKRLFALAAYGSVVTGDFIAGFSDLDLLVVVRDELTVDDAITLQQRMPEPPGVAYVQPSFHLMDHPVPHLVPAAFHTLLGELPEGFVATEQTLLQSSAETLHNLPPLLVQDARDWTGAMGEKRLRHVRLMVTRLKPAVRATLVRLGEPPLEVWRMPWDALALRWSDHDEGRAAALADVLSRLRSIHRDERACGEAVLRLLATL
jgi:hypothetical protein